MIITERYFKSFYDNKVYTIGIKSNGEAVWNGRTYKSYRGARISLARYDETVKECTSEGVLLRWVK